MDNTTSNVPETIRQEAKARALKIIEQNPGCQSYVRPEDLETAALFIPVVSVIMPAKDDFYDPIPGIGIMGKPQLVNLIREKAGIEIVRTETSKRGEHIWVAHVWGQKRQPDGSMLPEDASYEFNADERAELDFINQPSKYSGDVAKRKHILELAKFGEQRAVTGAQHALIHKLAHVARSFKTPEELMRGMIVSRVDRNVNGVLADPTLRGAALDRMLGATETVFGPKQIEGQPVARTVNEQTGEVLPQQPSVDDFELEPDPEPSSNPIQSTRALLEGYRERIKASSKATQLLDSLLADPNTTLEQMNKAIDRFEDWIQRNAAGRTA